MGYGSQSATGRVQLRAEADEQRARTTTATEMQRDSEALAKVNPRTAGRSLENEKTELLGPAVVRRAPLVAPDGGQGALDLAPALHAQAPHPYRPLFGQSLSSSSCAPYA